MHYLNNSIEIRVGLPVGRNAGNAPHEIG